MLQEILVCRIFITAVLCVSGLIVGTPPASGAVSKGWKASVPDPVFDREPGYVDLYWEAWELAHEHIKEQKGLPQPRYIDEAFWDDTIWIWDTCFMVMFCKYAPDEFPGVESLNNFYFPLHDKSYEEGTFPLNIQHPDNPPLFAWVEHDNFMVTDNRDHVVNLLTGTKYLQKHFEWFDTVTPGWRFSSKAQRRKNSVPVRLKKHKDGYLWRGIQSTWETTRITKKTISLLIVNIVIPISIGLSIYGHKPHRTSNSTTLTSR